MLSVLLRYTDYDCPFGIFKLFLILFLLHTHEGTTKSTFVERAILKSDELKVPRSEECRTLKSVERSVNESEEYKFTKSDEQSTQLRGMLDLQEGGIQGTQVRGMLDQQDG